MNSYEKNSFSSFRISPILQSSTTRHKYESHNNEECCMAVDIYDQCWLEHVKKMNIGLHVLYIFSVGLWALVNNAGLNMLGDVELCTMAMFHRIAEVNLYGMIRMSKAFLPFIRKSKGKQYIPTSNLEKLRNIVNFLIVNGKYQPYPGNNMLYFDFLNLLLFVV